MRVVTLDFETYFDSKGKYSLTCMGPLEYVRDPRFYVQCVSIRIDKGETYVIEAIDGKDSQVLHALKLDAPGTITVGHNLNGFDCLVLSEHYGIHPFMLIDTIPMMHWLGLSRVMSRSHKALTALLGHGTKQAGTVVSDGKKTKEEFTPDEWAFFLRYCRDDTLQCSENFYSMLPFMNADALKLMSLTAKMATEPAFIPDSCLLKDYKSELDMQSVLALEKLQKFLHFGSVDAMLKGIRSRSTFPQLLADVGGVCPMKWSEKQGKEIPAISKTDLEFTKLLNSDNEKVRLLVQTRLEQNSSIQMSRTQSLLGFADKPIPIMLSVLNAHTGRYTAGNEGKSDGLNFQNLSKRDPSKLALRKALRVPEGYSVVACDSSQIEARILAWVSGQTDLVEQFMTGRDPYAEMASKIFHVPAQDIHNAAKSSADPRHDKYKTYRNVGKTCVLSCLAPDTLVLTDSGYKYITAVTTDDLLWDGEKWTSHKGLIYRGEKKVCEWQGLHMTPDHLIYDSTSWVTAEEFLRTPSCWKSAVCSATEPLLTATLKATADIIVSSIKSNATTAEQSSGSVVPVPDAWHKTIAHIVLNDYQLTLDHLSNATQTLAKETSLGSLLSSRVSVVSRLLEAVQTVWSECAWCSVPVAVSRITYCSATSETEEPLDVINVPSRNLMTPMSSNTLHTLPFVQMLAHVEDCLTALLPLSKDVITHAVESMLATVAEELNSALPVEQRAYSTYLHYRDMMIHCCLLTALTIMVTTHEVTCVLQTSQSKIKTSAQSKLCKLLSQVCRKNWTMQKQNSLDYVGTVPVYDIADAGNRHCFAVWSKKGLVLVHNCGYGVGAQKFSDTLLRTKVHLDPDPVKHLEMAQQAHAIYRQSAWAIVQFWRTCNKVAQTLTANTQLGEYGRFGAHDEFGYGRAIIPLSQINCAFVSMPNGYRIWYPNLRFEQEDGRNVMLYDRYVHGKVVPNHIYGGGVTENVCQSLAFMMLGWQACRMADAGIPLKANIHDAWITVVPTAQAEHVKATMEHIMSSVPDWLAGFPVGCEAEIGTDFTIA
jgi:hypothetical protein